MRRTPQSRRDFVKKSVYTAPIIFSLQAKSAVAKSGSEKELKEEKPRSKHNKFRG